MMMTQGSAVNRVNARDVYPTAGRSGSTGQTGSANSQYSKNQSAMQTPPAPQPATAPILTVAGWLGLIGLILALHYGARYFGNAEDYKSIRLTVSNVFLIALVAATGIPALKVFVTKFPIPGVREVIMAS